MLTITECWAVEAQDPTICEWVVYASREPDEKGEEAAMVPARERCAQFDRPEGTWFTRVVGRRRDCSETPWETAPVKEHHNHGGDLVPPNPLLVGVGIVEPHLVGRVTYDAPDPDETPHVVQVIQGPDEWRGKLLHEENAEARGPLFPDAARLRTVEFPVDGEGGTTTIVVRTLGYGGTPCATAVSRTVARPVMRNGYRKAIASISGTTRVNFPAAAGTDAWEYDASDGLRSKAFPAYENLTSDYGTYDNPGTGSFFEAKAGANYPTEIKVESDEVDLGENFGAFRLIITDTLQRDSATQAAFDWEDLTYFPAFPADEPLESEQAESPAWYFRELLLLDSKPRQPLRKYRYEYVIGTSPTVDHADSDYVPYVPGQYLTGRYLRVRLRAAEPLGQHQIICPSMTIVAFVPNVVGSLASLAHTTIHRETADQTVGNTTTETSVVNAGAGLTLLGGTLGTNRIVELVLEGTYLNNSGAARNLTLRVKYGATEVIEAAMSSMAASANRRSFRLTVRLSADGGTGDQRGTLEALMSPPGSPATGTGGFIGSATSLFQGRIAGDAAEDSTADKVLDVTVEHSTNDANLTLTVDTVEATLR